MYEQKMYPLKLVETADYYLLVLDRLVKGSNIIDFAVELYNMIDSIPQVYSSLLQVSSDIYSTLPKMFRNEGIEATEIFNHVSKICDGMKSKNYLEKYDINGDRTLKKYTQDKPTSFTIPVSSRNTTATFPNISAAKGDPMPFDNQDGFTYSVLSEDTTAQIPFEMLEQPIQEKQHWFILYNSLYEITFVVKHYNDVINALIEDFSDFQLMLEIADIIEENVDICKKFFHKKSWVEYADALEMVKSFQKLYSVDSNTKSPEATTERDQVFEILNKYFIINNNPTQRMRAVELYTTVANLLPGFKDRVLLHKRLASYFLEKGLTRKRYTDGIYYYGITRKQTSPVNVVLEKFISDRANIEELISERGKK